MCRLFQYAISIGLLCLPVLAWSDALAEASSADERGPVERIEDSLKRTGKSIEEGVKNTAKKIEDKRIPEKVEQKFKDAMDKTAEAIEKTGKYIEKKFNQ